jgi:hypothetical protein
MSAIIKMKQVFGLLGFIGFLLCAWFAYQCGLGARASASRAYTLWLNVGTGPGQVQAASRQNGLWLLAMAASVLLAVLFLSACLYSRRRAVLRKGIGLMLLAGSCAPFGFAFTILSPLLNIGGTLTPGASVSSWSSGGITLQGWQMYAGVLLFALAALSMIVGGAYLLLSPPRDD